MPGFHVLSRKTFKNVQELKAALEGASVVVKAKVGDEGQLFGSITSQMIVDAVKEAKDLEIDRRRIEVSTAIKTAGEHTVSVSLYREIRAELKVSVVDIAAAVEPEPAAEEAPEAEEAAPAADAADTAIDSSGGPTGRNDIPAPSGNRP